jgi:eukaryotic-like serine/threonine-protein kinase
VTELRGRVLAGRYELGLVLGAGGMATVYLADDRVLERQVAVKVLSASYALDPLAVERFRAEACTAARLSHPNIVAVFDSGSDAGVHYLVMEYVPGQTLAQLLRRRGPLPPWRAAELTSQVCAALATAHAHGVVHRDVKPGNVLLDRDGRVKVADFGIAKAAAAPALTGDGMVLGTAAYLSPEQAQGEPVDPRSDVYALGCVLYELLTGAPPFGSAATSSPVAVAVRQVSQAPEPPSRRNPRIPAPMDAVVLTAMAKQPEQRYQSTQAMHGDLTRVLAGRSAPAGPSTAEAPTELCPTLPAAVRPASARRPGWAPVRLLAAAGVVVALMVAMLWPDGAAPAGRAQATPTVVPASTSAPTTTSAPPTTAPPQGRVKDAAAPDRGGHHERAKGHGAPKEKDKPKAPGRGDR